MLDRSYFEKLDAHDPLARVVSRFRLPGGIVYLDGNSLGPLPANVAGVVAGVVERQWGKDLITSWNGHGWWTLARRVGDRVATLIGAPPGTVVVGDTTTVALYKAASAALGLRPGRSVVLTDSGNFPTDLYTLGSVTRQAGAELVIVDPEDVAERIDDSTAVLAVTHVDYRTGRRHDMARLTERAHGVGAVVVWDLCHSVGAMDLDSTDVDLAVGCGYKYLNGGPGAPAFVYVNAIHHDRFLNPINGWWGHIDPFGMQPEFVPAQGIAGMQVGTQPILSLAALDAALDVFDGVDPKALRAKSELLTESFIRLADQRLPGFEVVTPRDVDHRGSHVSLAHTEAHAIMAALIGEGVIGDVRPPNLLRFGLAPAFQSHVDVWDAIDVLVTVMAEERWRSARPGVGVVT